MPPIVIRKRVMPSRRLSASARRLAPTLTGALLLASCSSLLGIEDPVPRDAEGGSSSGGVPGSTAGKSANPSEGGVGGEAVTPRSEGGEGGAIHSTEIGGAGGETGGAPPQIDCVNDERRCDVYQRQICVSGHWMDDGDECPLACVDGECQTPASCSPPNTSTPCVDGVSCCETIWMDAGSYLMGHGDEEDEASYERVVSGFYLDRFEVTVGRFRKFHADFTLPVEGAGEHPRLPGTGWQVAWETLPHEFAASRNAVPIDGDDLVKQLTDDCDASTWADGDPELPINCVNWYVAFAFCVYDGGRLPTEAEWNYAAALGDAQRPYPWSQSTSDTSVGPSNATFYNYPDPLLDLPTTVGSHAAGRGGFSRFSGRGHDDLGGNVTEWTLDEWIESPDASCSADCFAAWTGGASERVIRGGAYQSPYNELRSGSRPSAPAPKIGSYFGFRCARDITTNPPE